MKIKHLFIFISILLICVACSNHTVHTTQEYAAWINQPENTCKVSKKVGDMLVSVKYLPSSFLALKDYESSDHSVSYEALLKSYMNSVTFIMSFETPQGQAGEDVMYKDLSSYKQYVERSMTLNFDLESKVILNAGTYQYAPVLSSLENTYGLSKGRDVYLVFTSKEKEHDLLKEPVLDFVYSDDIYNVGILHFTYNFQEILKTLPVVELKK